MSTVHAGEVPISLERHGIDYVPPGERHGRPFTLFTFWAASNVQILAISVGALAIVFGLSLPWAIFWLFLIIFILGVGSGNFGNLYGPFLTLFATISPSGRLASKSSGRAARIITTTVIAIIGTLIAIKASSNFITDLSNFLVFTLYLLVPWTAINLTDYYLIRRGHYDIPELFKADGIYGTFSWYALAVYALAVGVQFPFMNDPPVYVGPVSTALGGADIAWIVGFAVAAAAYYAGARYRIFTPARAEDGSRIPEDSAQPSLNTE